MITFNTEKIFNHILKLFCYKKISIKDMENLLKLQVFTNYEKERVEECLQMMKTLGYVDYEKYIQEHRYYTVEDNEEINQESKVIYSMIQWFIEERSTVSIVNEVYKIRQAEKYHSRREIDNMMSKLKVRFQKNDDLRLGVLAKEICKKKLDNIYSDIDLLYLKESKGIKFNNEIDKYFSGINPATNICIVGNNIEINRFFAMQLLYEALKKGLNICYLSFNRSKLSILVEFIAKYGIEKDRNYNYDDITKRKLKQEELKKMAENFRLRYGKNLNIVDGTDLEEFNEIYIRQTLNIVDCAFLSNSNKGIEIIVVDSLEDLHIDTTKGAIHNQQAILSYYLELFRDLKKLSYYKDVCVIMMSDFSDSGRFTAVKNDGNVSISDTKTELSHYADIIVSVYNNTNLLEELQDECKVKVLKDNNMSIMLEPINIKINRQQFCFKKKEISLIKSRYNKLFSTEQAKAIFDNYRKQKEIKLN